HIVFDLDVIYHTPLPAGSKLLCANHPTTLDPVMMTTLVHEQVSILITETLFKVPGLGKSLAAAGHIPVFSSNGRQALEEGIRTLQAGRTVGIFPEGEISQAEGGLAHIHTGAARLAIATGVPLIPIGIALDKDKIFRVKTIVDGKVEVGTWYLNGGYAITVGKPMLFQDDPSNKYVSEVTDQIAGQILELSKESARRLADRRPQKPIIYPALKRSWALFSNLPVKALSARK
ncbi:MAG: lysophospholipid acyltransferase family protein, partial [Omnitrophica WOR_2 bacterium]